MAAQIGKEQIIVHLLPEQLNGVIQGWMSDVEVMAMMGFAKMLEGEVEGDILEIGCYRGRSTSGLAQVGRVVVVDIFTGGENLPHEDVQPDFERNMRDRGLLSRVTIIRGDSKTHLAKLEPHRFRIALVDGGHSTPSALADLRGVWPLMSPGGIVFIDDINWPSVKTAVEVFDVELKDAGRPALETKLVTTKLAYKVKL